MKRLKYLFISIIGLMILSPGVKADVIYTVDDFDLSEYETAINVAYDYINNNDYNYYTMFLGKPKNSKTIAIYLRVFNDPVSSFSLNVSTSEIIYQYDTYITAIDILYDGTIVEAGFYSAAIDPIYSNSLYGLYDTNISFINNSGFSIVFDGLFGTTATIKNNQPFPTLKNGLLLPELTEVNLDNYHYVLLSLKDYNQTEAFDTNLKVKGMIGITPIYNFGTTEKTTITDRCNLSYSDYTDYRLYVLKEDLNNNAIYAVKSCKDGSSFKFDSSIFNITYVTDDNVDDPVVVIDGQEYHTIPFDQLSNSANKNEENNFIPGESGSSFSDIIDNAISFISDIWNAFLSFMSLGTKFFNVLPPEFRALSIIGFTVLITIAVIKFLKS